MISFIFLCMGFFFGYIFRKKQRQITDWFKNPEKREPNNGDN